MGYSFEARRPLSKSQILAKKSENVLKQIQVSVFRQDFIVKTRIAFVGIFSLSASIVAAEPNLFGRWTTPAGEEMLMKSGGGSQYVGKIDEIEAFSGVLSDNGQVTGKVMGWLHDGEVKNACDETWHEMWQEGQWNLSSDGLTLSGYFEPIKVMSMPFFKMCYPEYLPKETHKYTRKKTCGPDISNSLKGVLDRVEDEFKDKGINNGERTKACELLFSYNPLDFDDQDQVINAWDILDLQLAGTKWLQHTRFTERGLGTPYDKDDIENSEGCGNSVQVGDGSYLAGTVNYSIFGLMAKLCNGHDISFSLQAAQTRVNNWKAALPMSGLNGVTMGTIHLMSHVGSARTDKNVRSFQTPLMFIKDFNLNGCHWPTLKWATYQRPTKIEEKHNFIRVNTS